MMKNTDVSEVSFSEVWIFKLYICGQNPRAIKAYFNLKKVCDERLDGKYRIEVVDLVQNPTLARSNNITACPTVIKEAPFPRRVIIGDLSKTEAVLTKLDFPSVPLLPDFNKSAKSVAFENFRYNLIALLGLRYGQT